MCDQLRAQYPYQGESTPTELSMFCLSCSVQLYCHTIDALLLGAVWSGGSVGAICRFPPAPSNRKSLTSTFQEGNITSLLLFWCNTHAHVAIPCLVCVNLSLPTVSVPPLVGDSVSTMMYPSADGPHDAPLLNRNFSSVKISPPTVCAEIGWHSIGILSLCERSSRGWECWPLFSPAVMRHPYAIR